MNKENNQLTSSRKFVIRDINATLSAPISRIGCCPQGREDEGRKGFTLIELLVVVLIIGILAAIALPQYQKAIMKSRFSTLKPIAKSVKDAQEVYYMRNGQYATQAQLADLDVGVPANAGITISDTAKHDFVRATHNGLPHNSYVAYLDHSENFAGNIYCEAFTGDTNAEQLCVAEGGTAGPVNGDYTLYLLSGNSTGAFAPSVLKPTGAACSYYSSAAVCDVYDLGNGHTLEIKEEGGTPLLVAYEYDEFGTKISHGYVMAGTYSLVSGVPGYWPSGKGLCDVYPTLDLCQ